jgi:putative tryptophan/tyrosine transport system substrate-binding protein
MRRRDVIAMLGSAAAAWPLGARAQQPSTIRRIGLLDYSVRPRLWDAFRQRMRELGYVEGKTVAFESRCAEDKADRLPALAAGLVNLPVDVIVAASAPAIQAAKQATGTIPIVMAIVADPVGLGLVASLGRPAGNVTGFALLNSDLSGKRLELLRQAVPQASRFAQLWDADSPPARIDVQNTESAAQALSLPLQSIAVRSAEDFDGAFASMERERVTALIVGGSPLFFAARTRLADLAAKYGLPTLFNERSYAEAGGLLAYGSDFTVNFQRAADYADKILRGAKPADLPVEQPSKFELVINLKTARALGLTIPPTLLALADEVIE